MKPYWTNSDGTTSWYRVHILDKNYSVKVEESPFEEDVSITEIKLEWSGGKNAARPIDHGAEYDRVSAAFRAAKNAVQIAK